MKIYLYISIFIGQRIPKEDSEISEKCCQRPVIDKCLDLIPTQLKLRFKKFGISQGTET